MCNNPLFPLIDANAPRFQAFLERLVAQESFTLETEAVTRAADLTARFAEELGFSVRKQPFPKAGNGLVIFRETESTLPPVLFVGHLDTVHPSGSFPKLLKTAPEGGLYGPGIVDCKGGAVIALLAMFALRETGCPHPLRLILTSDEEMSNRLTGSEGIRFLTDTAHGCAAAFVCECGKRGEVVVARKGVTKVRIDIKGRAAHAGMYYSEGISAIREAAVQILALEQESRPEGITYNCGLISGGTTENVVPEACSYSVDIRYRNAEEERSAMELLRRVIDSAHVPGTTSVLTILSSRSPMPHSEAGMVLFEHLRTTALRHGMEELRPVQNGGGSDAAYTAAIGIPTVCAVGMTGWDWHTKKERNEPDSLAQRAKLLSAAVAELPPNFLKNSSEKL